MRTHASAQIVLSLFLAVGLVGCGAGRSSEQSTQPRAPADRIVEAELVPLAQFSAYEVIERLRPQWFQTRTRLEPMLHVDGNVREDGVAMLRSLRAGDVQEMRYMSPSDATTRFGTGYGNGLILVTTKR